MWLWLPFPHACWSPNILYFEQICWIFDSVMRTAEEDIYSFHCRTRHCVIVLEMWKIMSCWKAYIFLTTKHNSGLLLAIGLDLSTLVFQTNQDNYEEQVLGWNSMKNKPFLTERIWHVLAMSLVLGFTVRAGRGVSWTSWALTCANSCTGELEVPSSSILGGDRGV